MIVVAETPTVAVFLASAMVSGKVASTEALVLADCIEPSFEVFVLVFLRGGRWLFMPLFVYMSNPRWWMF